MVSPAENIFNTTAVTITSTGGSVDLNTCTWSGTDQSDKDLITFYCSLYNYDYTSKEYIRTTLFSASTLRELSGTHTMSGYSMQLSSVNKNYIMFELYYGSNHTIYSMNLLKAIINGASGTYSLSFSIDPIKREFSLGVLYIRGITLVLGGTPYTWDEIYSPIATYGDIPLASGAQLSSNNPASKVIIANPSSSAFIYSLLYTIDSINYGRHGRLKQYPSQTYALGTQAIRFADIDLNNYSESSW